MAVVLAVPDCGVEERWGDRNEEEEDEPGRLVEGLGVGRVVGCALGILDEQAVVDLGDGLGKSHHHASLLSHCEVCGGWRRWKKV